MIAVLNRYLDAVSAAVFAHGGTVVSYQGDGVMAVFGAPLRAGRPRDARARRRARDPRRGAAPLQRLAAGAAARRAPLDAGIGLNSGPVMSGLVGSERRVEYAAVGDATNVAARLQALGRERRGRLFVAAAPTTLGDAPRGCGAMATSS